MTDKIQKIEVVVDKETMAKAHDHAADNGLTIEEAFRDMFNRGYHRLKAKDLREE